MGKLEFQCCHEPIIKDYNYFPYHVADFPINLCIRISLRSFVGIRYTEIQIFLKVEELHLQVMQLIIIPIFFKMQHRKIQNLLPACYIAFIHLYHANTITSHLTPVSCAGKVY